jgi:hypothetical protein
LMTPEGNTNNYSLVIPQLSMYIIFIYKLYYIIYICIYIHIIYISMIVG